MRVRLTVGLGVVLIMACQAEWYGTGNVYVWNGTPLAMSVSIEGRTPGKLRVSADSGKAVRDAIAGPYRVTLERHGAKAEHVEAELHKGRLLVINVGGAGCLARSNVIGMYRKGSQPVRLLELYTGEQIVPVADLVSLLPGDKLPTRKPKGALTFQRLSVVPCGITDDQRKVEAFVKRQR